MKIKRAAVFAALFLVSHACATMAQDVTLTSRDGRIVLSGALLGFDGRFYRLDTIYGELTADGAGMICSGDGCPDPLDFKADISISGDAAVGAVMMPALIESFARRYDYEVQREITDATHVQFTLSDPHTEQDIGVFRLRLTSTDEGFADLLANEAGLVVALRRIRPEENARAIEAGVGDMASPGRSRVLALDALLPVVAPGRDTSSITLDDLARALSGRMTRWPESPPGDATDITLYVQSDRSGSGQRMRELILESRGLSVSPEAREFDSPDALIAALSDDPHGLGMSRMSHPGTAQRLAMPGGCGPVPLANPLTIKTGDYPAVMPVLLYLPARRMPKLARDFLAFTETPEAQLVIRRSGFADLAPEEIAVSDQGHRFANAISRADSDAKLRAVRRVADVLKAMTRLTVTVRFIPGTQEPDAQSHAALKQLVRALNSGRFDGQRLLFAEFGPVRPSDETDAEDTRSDAEIVREFVSDRVGRDQNEAFDFEVNSFGDSMPLICRDGSDVTQINRRVEIWTGGPASEN